jgi:hypothetical protein
LVEIDLFKEIELPIVLAEASNEYINEVPPYEVTRKLRKRIYQIILSWNSKKFTNQSEPQTTKKNAMQKQTEQQKTQTNYSTNNIFENFELESELHSKSDQNKDNNKIMTIREKLMDGDVSNKFFISLNIIWIVKPISIH